jgi:hypothetical protein
VPGAWHTRTCRSQITSDQQARHRMASVVACDGCGCGCAGGSQPPLPPTFPRATAHAARTRETGTYVNAPQSIPLRCWGTRNCGATGSGSGTRVHVVQQTRSADSRGRMFVRPNVREAKFRQADVRSECSLGRMFVWPLSGSQRCLAVAAAATDKRRGKQQHTSGAATITTNEGRPVPAASKSTA